MLGRRVSRGRCWMISIPLASYLQILGHECKVIEGAVDGNEPHVWIELPNATIVDATADQFSKPGRRLPPVYIGPKPAAYRVISHADLSLEVEAAAQAVTAIIKKRIGRQMARKVRAKLKNENR